MGYQNMAPPRLYFTVLYERQPIQYVYNQDGLAITLRYEASYIILALSVQTKYIVSLVIRHSRTGILGTHGGLLAIALPYP